MHGCTDRLKGHLFKLPRLNCIAISVGKAPPKIPQVNQDSGLEVGVADGCGLKEEKIPYTILVSIEKP